MESQRAKAKASEVARLLFDLSESDMTPCVTTRMELAHYTREVQGLITRNASSDISDRLFWLLKGLSQGHGSSRLRFNPVLTFQQMLVTGRTILSV